MSINCIDILDNELKEKLRLAKKDCLTLTSISYGVLHEVDLGDKVITIYSLLPTLESIQIIKRENKESCQVYMVKANLVANISKESLEELLREIKETSDELTNTGTYREIMIPEEIKSNLGLLEHLSLQKQENVLDSAFSEYAELISQVRKTQALNLDKAKR